MLTEAIGGKRSSSTTMTSFFLKELQYSLVDPILDNIPEIPTRISITILGVMILTVYFSPEFLFVGELVILRKCDVFLFQKEIFLNICHIKSIQCMCIGGL